MPPVSGSALPAPAAERILREALLDLADADPYPGYRRLREQAPVLLTRDGVLVLTRHADCAAALRHRFLRRQEGMLGRGAAEHPGDGPPLGLRVVQDGMAYAGPSEHSRLRRLVSSAFSGRHVEALRRRVTARVDARLRALARTPGADFMRGFALPLPVEVIADLLGLPEEVQDDLLSLVGDMDDALRPGAGTAAGERALAAQEVLADRFEKLLVERRTSPEDGLLSRLAGASADDALTAAEITGVVFLLFEAGGETVSHVLGNALHALLGHPDQFGLLCREPSLIPGAVEELLRYDTPVQVDSRRVSEPFAFLGAELEPGQTVLTVLGAANRDPAQHEDPERLDVTRSAPHLTFAAGPHCCLGSPLARLELEVLLRRLTEEHPRCVPAGPPSRDGGAALRGFARLPVALSP